MRKQNSIYRYIQFREPFWRVRKLNTVWYWLIFLIALVLILLKNLCFAGCSRYCDLCGVSEGIENDLNRKGHKFLPEVVQGEEKPFAPACSSIKKNSYQFKVSHFFYVHSIRKFPVFFHLLCPNNEKSSVIVTDICCLAPSAFYKYKHTDKTWPSKFCWQHKSAFKGEFFFSFSIFDDIGVHIFTEEDPITLFSR